MSDYVYKCIEVPEIINTGSTGNGKHQNAIKSYENIINNVAKDGWELVNIDTITSLQNPGCLAQIIGLFLGGAKSETATYKLLIFKKPNRASLETKTIQTISTTYKCPSCHSNIDKEDMFCENCGNKLK